MTKLPIKNQKLFDTALTHRSYLNENPKVKQHNERLEFLGDAVLELIVSSFLFDQYPGKPEGWLTALRAALVKTTTLAEIAKNLKLGEELRLSRGEEQGGGRQNPSLLANTFEAVIGAIYLDSGYDTAQQFIATHLFPETKNIIDQQLLKDYKSLFQEAIQSQNEPTPTYKVIKASGPDHNKTFIIKVFVCNKPWGRGTGKSKQEAEQQAAKKALETLEEN